MERRFDAESARTPRRFDAPRYRAAAPDTRPFAYTLPAPDARPAPSPTTPRDPPSKPEALRPPSNPSALRPPSNPSALRPPSNPSALRPPSNPSALREGAGTKRSFDADKNREAGDAGDAGALAQCALARSQAALRAVRELPVSMIPARHLPTHILACLRGGSEIGGYATHGVFASARD